MAHARRSQWRCHENTVLWTTWHRDSDTNLWLSACHYTPTGCKFTYKHTGTCKYTHIQRFMYAVDKENNNVCLLYNVLPFYPCLVRLRYWQTSCATALRLSSQTNWDGAMDMFESWSMHVRWLPKETCIDTVNLCKIHPLRRNLYWSHATGWWSRSFHFWNSWSLFSLCMSSLPLYVHHMCA